VKLSDPRNRQNLSEFLGLAIPSTLIIVAEWSGYDIQALIAGLLSKNDQVFVIISLNIALQSFTIQFGIATACTTLIGNAMGEGNVKLAKAYYHQALVFAAGVITVQGSILWFYQDQIFNTFTRSDAIKDIQHNIYWIVFIVLVQDFWQNIFGGVFRGLGKQGLFNKINFISYYVLLLPLSILFVFYIGTNENYYMADQKRGMGQIGIWYAFIIALSHQIIGQVVFLHFVVDWQKECDIT